MVQWKGDLDYNQVGEKAKHLDQVNNFNVPNFFAVTKEEVEQILPNQRDPEKIKNTRMDREIRERLSDSYSNVGVASEIRNASGKAKNLVGNRRETSRVSVRVSTSKKGSYYQLNVGSSNIERAVKNVLASYYEDHSEVPAVIVQKMVEPGHTGAIHTDYKAGYTLIESVKGLGTPLEEGKTNPEVYLIKDNNIVDKRLPEKQLEVSRHPVNGKNRQRNVQRDKSPYKKRKMLKAVSNAANSRVNLKYVYKRGTFYIVDAEPAENPAPEPQNLDLDIIEASGDIDSESNRLEIIEELEDLKNIDSEKVISRKGGYTSTISQKAREKDLNLGVNPRESFLQEQKTQQSDVETETRSREVNPFSEGSQNTRTATLDVLSLNKGRNSLRTKPPFRGTYNIISGRGQENDIPEENVLTSYSEVFVFEGNTAVLDSRLVPRQGLESALNYLEADEKILIAAQVDREILRELIISDFDAVAIENQKISEVAELIELEERKIILDKVREI
jgi:hypothetical protein